MRATKKQKAKKKKNTSMDVVRLLESHTRRTANRFSIQMLFVFGLPLFYNSPRLDALECLVFTIYKGTFNYLTAFGSRKTTLSLFVPFEWQNYIVSRLFTKIKNSYIWPSTDFFSNRLKTSRVYSLKFGSQKIPVYCHMGDFGCGDGGWTLAMKIDGTKVHVLRVTLCLWYGY